MQPNNDAVPGSRTARLEAADTRRMARLLSQLAPPTICFGLSRALLHAAAISTGNNPFEPSTWSRWDSGQYLSIAHRGYELSSCEGFRGYDPNDWCGNDAWLPGYPALINLVAHAANLPYVAAGVRISAVFAYASLLTIWLLYLKAKLTVRNALLLLLASFFPGQVYHHAVFPVSLFVFCLLLSLWLYARRQTAFAGLCAFIAAFSYSSGLFLCGAFCLDVLLLKRDRLMTKTQWKQLAYPSASVILGFSAALGLQWLQTGVWNAFFLVQHKYAYSPRMPFELWRSSSEQFLREWPHVSGPNEQTLFVCGMMVLVLVCAFRRLDATRLDVLLAAFAVIYWLLPIMLGGSLSLYRAEATLLPVVALARRIPWPILIILIGIAIQLSWLMGREFFNGTIV